MLHLLIQSKFIPQPERDQVYMSSTRRAPSSSSALQAMLEEFRARQMAKSEESDAMTAWSPEQELIKRIKRREERRDAAAKTAGGGHIAASYQREIDADTARLTAMRKARERIKT